MQELCNGKPICDASREERIASAKKWLVNSLFAARQIRKPLIRVRGDTILYFVSEHWIFELNKKDRVFRTPYYFLWQIFYHQFFLSHEDVVEIIRDVMLKPINCENYMIGYFPIWFF
jgi:hypothetical protein